MNDNHEKRAAVVIDTWKLGTFQSHLEKNGYKCTASPGLTPGTLVLTVPLYRCP